MPDAAHSYSAADRAALALLGAGRCYWPGCTEPLLGTVDGKFKLALQIAHIRAANQGGERYVEGMTDKELSSFRNLIFLCTLHHKAVDETGVGANKYPITTLERWKSERESNGIDALNRYTGVSEEAIVGAIVEVMQERDDRVLATLERLEHSDLEAAALLRELSAEVRELRNGRHIVDPDVVSMLDSAARSLVGLPDHAAALQDAAKRVAQQINRMDGYM
jgi:hypothetical protein